MGAPDKRIERNDLRRISQPASEIVDRFLVLSMNRHQARIAKYLRNFGENLIGKNQSVVARENRQ